MKTLLLLFTTLCLSAAVYGQNTIIPRPLSVEKKGEGSFELKGEVAYSCPEAVAPALLLGLDRMTSHSAITLKASDQNKQIVVQHDKSLANDEAYTLDVSQRGILIRAKSPSGVYYATQSLLQLMPPEAFDKAQKLDSVKVPFVKIKDAPRFGWRGLMLDSSRHFQTVDEVKRFIDLMAVYKFNVFHWHITDSHGWRLEVKKYPKLTEVGAWREQPDYPEKGKKGRYGGFYTQEQIKDVVAYAKARQITILPEVDMPGHSFSAVASYPELGCQQKPQHVDYFFTYPADRQRFPSRRGYTDVLCASRPKTLEFCKDVIDEVMELFPSEYVHIGGDEVEKHNWRHCDHCQAFIKEKGLKGEDGLQSWFIQQLDDYITSKGRVMIGWDEILQGGLAKNAVVMSWQGERGGIRAAKMGHDVVMSPQTYIYLDHGQSHSPLEPPHWPGHKPLERVYSYNPIPKDLSAREAEYVLGVQANVWTAFIHKEWKLDLSTWPRAAAVAEVGWTSMDNKNWDDFHKRLAGDGRKRLDALGVNYW